MDRLMATLTFREEPESPVGRDTAEVDVVDASKGHSVVRAIHEARRLRQAADLDGALETLAGAVMTPDDTESSAVDPLRVEATGEETVRPPERAGLQPGHGPGGCASAPRRRRNA